MSESQRYRVAYLGPKGSFTHQAALQYFPSTDDHSLEAHTDFLEIFSAVHNGSVDRGVIPVENSTNGFVVQILDHFADARNQHPDVSIVGETFVAVQQSLLGRRRSSANGASRDGKDSVPDLSRVKMLYSHPQAWGQCVPFLTEYLRGAERVDTTSTSRAAEVVARDTTGSSAAICSPLAAELYGLDVLVPSIEEKKGNTTRFLVLRNSKTLASTSALNGVASSREQDGGRFKSLIGFTVPHTQPSSLANALAVFGKHGINLTSLNSRPNEDRKWNYIFFVEFWGRKGDIVVEEALKEVNAVVETCKWFGSWVSSRGDEGW